MHFTLRLFEPGDVPAMVTLFYRSVHEVACAHYTPEQLMVWAPDDMTGQGWDVHFANHPTWLAFQEGQLAGFTDLEADGHLDMMFVSPDFQGQGVASLLYEAVEKQALEQNNKRIYVEASLTARGFFERKGFHVVEAQMVERNQVSLKNFRMEKRL